MIPARCIQVDRLSGSEDPNETWHLHGCSAFVNLELAKILADNAMHIEAERSGVGKLHTLDAREGWPQPSSTDHCRSGKNLRFVFGHGNVASDSHRAELTEEERVATAKADFD